MLSASASHINTHFFSLHSHWASHKKIKKASSISKQTVTCIFLHSIHPYLFHKRFIDTDFLLFFFFFTTDLASLFFTRHSQKMIVYSRARQLSQGTCALIHTCIYKTIFLSSLLLLSPSTADVFLRFSRSHIMINLPFIYLLYFFFTPHLSSSLFPLFFF